MRILTRKFKFLNINLFNKIQYVGQCSLSNMEEPGSGYPLNGIRVLDLTRIVAGPYCTMILGDLGADVIKIEQPYIGDEARHWVPPFVSQSKESCYFVALNRNKKSVCIDMKTEKGQRILHDLLPKCDVLVENFIPGKLKKFGLDYEQIKELSPKIIYCSITGYGSVGPYKTRPGYDVIASSIGGLIHITGPKDGDPCKPGVALVDIATGLYAHGAIMAALLQRMKTGKGQKIDCNLLSTQVSCLINIGSNYLNAGLEAQRHGTAHPSIVPYQSFKVADGGYLTIGAGSNSQFNKLCQMIGEPHLASDQRFLNNEDRVKNRTVLLDILSTCFKNKTMKEWLKMLEGATFPYGPVNSMSEVFNDPHIKDIGLVKTLNLQSGQEVKMVGPPVVYSDSKNTSLLPPPLLGQHTVEVLQEILGYKSEEIDSLKRLSVIQ